MAIKFLLGCIVVFLIGQLVLLMSALSDIKQEVSKIVDKLRELTGSSALIDKFNKFNNDVMIGMKASKYYFGLLHICGYTSGDHDNIVIGETAVKKETFGGKHENQGTKEKGS